MKVNARSKIVRGFFLFTVCAIAFGIYLFIKYKGNYFDEIIGDEPELVISYRKGFSFYKERVYLNRNNDDLFLRVVEKYIHDLNSKRSNFKIVNYKRLMSELRSLPFLGCSEDIIKMQVTFEINDWHNGTDICDGGRYIIIRSYKQK